MDEFQTKAVAHALKKLFDGNHFSICDLDNVCDLAGVLIPQAEYKAFRAVHCVHWSEMEPSFRRELGERILGLFRNPDNRRLRLELVNAPRTITPGMAARSDGWWRRIEG